MAGWQKLRHAPAAGTVLCPLGAVPDEGCKELRFGTGVEEFHLLLYRHGDILRAFVNCCPHFSLPLNAQPDEFLILQRSRIMCAWHCAVFRLEDGYCEEGPARGMSLDRVPISIRNDHVVIAEDPTRAG